MKHFYDPSQRQVVEESQLHTDEYPSSQGSPVMLRSYIFWGVERLGSGGEVQVWVKNTHDNSMACIGTFENGQFVPPASTESNEIETSSRNDSATAAPGFKPSLPGHIEEQLKYFLNSTSQLS